MTARVPSVAWVFIPSPGCRAWVADTDDLGRLAYTVRREEAQVFPTQRAARDVVRRIRRGSRAQGIAGVDRA